MKRFRHRAGSLLLSAFLCSAAFGQPTNRAATTVLAGPGESRSASNRLEPPAGHQPPMQQADLSYSGIADSPALRLLKLDRYDEAQAEAQKSLHQDPRDSGALFVLGRASFKKKDFPGAAGAFEKYVLLRTNNANAYLWLSRSFYRLKRYSEAESACRKAITINPSGAYAHFLLGLCLEGFERHDEAIVAFQKASSLDTNQAGAYFFTGLVQYQKEAYEAALIPLQKAVSLEPTNYLAQVRLGYDLYMLNQHGAAVDAFKEALRLDPDSFDACYWLGRALCHLNREDEAITAFNQVLSLNTNTTDALLWLGICQYDKKDYESAVVSLQKFVSLQPTNDAGFFQLGYVLYKLERYDAAADPLKKAVQLNPDSSRANYWLGCTLSALDRDGEAIPFFKQVLSLDTNLTKAYFQLGRCQYYRQSYQDAAASFQKYVSLEPTNFYGHRWLGRIYFFKLHRTAEATTAFQNALRFRPDDFDANLWRGMSLAELGRFNEAVPNLEKALAANPDSRMPRWLLLAAYLATGQPGKIPQLHLGFVVALAIAMTLLYVVALAWLMRKSLLPAPQPTPGIGFTLAWCGVMVDGQLILFLMPVVAFSLQLSQALGLGLILWALPLIAAAGWGFARQPWGEPFAWPLRIPRRKVLLTVLVATGVWTLGYFAYANLIESITHKPMPDQEIVSWIKAGMQSSPWLTFVGIAIAAPIAEEILFRGLLYGALQRWLSPRWTIVVTAVVFAAVHLQPVYFLPLFGLGLVLGLGRHQSGTLALPVFIHLLNNSISLLISLHQATGG
jgi:tetratricopeptide (TPR) repeat protein/membrane protease YdiL (CAAX protease family)